MKRQYIFNNATRLHFDSGMVSSFAYGKKIITSGTCLYYPKDLTYGSVRKFLNVIAIAHYIQPDSIFQNVLSWEIADIVFHLNEEQNKKAFWMYWTSTELKAWFGPTAASTETPHKTLLALLISDT